MLGKKELYNYVHPIVHVHDSSDRYKNHCMDSKSCIPYIVCDPHKFVKWYTHKNKPERKYFDTATSNCTYGLFDLLLLNKKLTHLFNISKQLAKPQSL